ncbi:MAG: ABC transporter ATP-binding protein [Ectothiorhodospiraceae bacterium]|nr:ABC transporter ATP-binding protein [Ectothiorhodospiraceae bacterium]MCH8504477.1 ABC transporter ATP-binding protein [Ectothiorhodospiraceae bacterium]
MARIEFSSLAHSYADAPAADQDYALKRLDHCWDDGGAYALLGPSGCGKTTLLNITSGLLAPSEGRVLFDGRDVTRLQPQERNIAQVFQFPVIYDTMTVYENLAFPLRNRKAPAEHIRKRVQAVAEMLELSQLLPRRARHLGAHEKQLISMGRGLVREDVSAVLFDEPLTVIDPHMKWVLRRKLREIHAEFGHTLIYVTHDQTEALTFADQVVVMDDGRVLQTGSPQDLFERPKHTFVGYFIGSPGMNVLPCRIDGERALLGDAVLPVPAVLVHRAAQRSGALELGIRPELIDITPGTGPGSLPASLERVDDMGNYQLLQVRIGDHRLAVTAPEQFAGRPGDPLHLQFQEAAALLYRDGQLVE